MQYQLIRSKRKTIAISFDRDGNLWVKAPLWVKDHEIEDFVASRREWIASTARRLEHAREEERSRQVRLENGDTLFYLGDQCSLTVLREERRRGKVKKVSGRLVLSVPYQADYGYKKDEMEKWYRREALRVISHKAEMFAKMLQVTFANIRIKDQKTRWGSCSSKGNLNFNWRILMAPEPVCDYVVIHELCHLIHMDHSEAFWQQVKEACPGYLQYRGWLRQNGNLLYPF